MSVKGLLWWPFNLMSVTIIDTKYEQMLWKPDHHMLFEYHVPDLVSVFAVIIPSTVLTRLSLRVESVKSVGD